MRWIETVIEPSPIITPADAQGTDWEEERRAFICRNPICRMDWYEEVYSEVVLTACQNAMAGAIAEAMALLRSLNRYDPECLEWLANMVRITPMPDPQRRAMFYGAVKMAHAFLWAEATHDD